MVNALFVCFSVVAPIGVAGYIHTEMPSLAERLNTVGGFVLAWFIGLIIVGALLAAILYSVGRWA